MTKKTGIYSRVAESINDFSVHRINRDELYEIICGCILESSDEEKEQVFSKNEFIRSDYHVAKNWLNKR